MDLSESIKIPAKVLLFGEYLVLNGGHSLSLPYWNGYMQRSFIASSNKAFYIRFAEYVNSLSVFENRLSPQFYEDIERGLHYHSTIPIGYGLGSSGALVAIIYLDYIDNKPSDLCELKHELALIENFFHDNSSGIDPLTSYTQQPLLLQNDQLFKLDHIDGLDQFSLYDSGLRRNAKQAIAVFSDLKKSVIFLEGLDKLGSYNNRLIQQFIDHGDITALMFQYSALQLDLFHKLVPESVLSIWTAGLDRQEYAMKLCGAGMGGMFLVYGKGLEGTLSIS